MRIFLVSLLGFLLASGAQARQPNILIIVADDMSPNVISAFGRNQFTSVATTPNIDSIATAGVKFTNSFVTSPKCEPSRATMLTGKYAHSVGFSSANGATFDATQQTFVRLLSGAGGYDAWFVGKWQISYLPGGLPSDAGFDHYAMMARGSDEGYIDPTFSVDGVSSPNSGYGPTLTTDHALAYLATRDTDPWLLVVNYFSPHIPSVPSAADDNLYSADLPHPTTFGDRLMGRSPPGRETAFQLSPDLVSLWNYFATSLSLRKTAVPSGLSSEEEANDVYQKYAKDYLRTVKSLDDEVGRLLDYLVSERISDDTLVIFTADNGTFVGEHFMFGKRHPHEESIRVPLLMQYPSGGADGIFPGTTRTEMVLNTDLGPTALAYAGESVPADMQGRSMRDLLDGTPATDWRRSFYFQLWRYSTSNTVPYYGIRTNRFKLIYYYGRDWGGDPAWELIDLEADPGELTNVYGDAQYAGVIQPLKAEMVSWQTGLGVPPSVMSCPGDLNFDGVISYLDFSIARRCFGLLVEGACTHADFDGNGFVTLNDVLHIARATGQSCTP